MGQGYVESALLFSQTKPGGSARIQAIGGSQIALGGDYSSALSNPAGLGMYNRSEVTFSMAVSGYNSSTKYLGDFDKDGKTILNIPGISAVFHSSKDNKEGFLGGSFAISMSRVNDFQGAISFGGTNKNSSIINSYIDQADGTTNIQFDKDDGWLHDAPVGLAYRNFLIGEASVLDPSFPDDEYFSDAPVYTDSPINTDQQRFSDTKGATNQWSISYGGNFNDILFFGGGIGISSLKYKSETIYKESFESDVVNSLNLTENLSTKGKGINATIGVIVRPVNFLQIGASFTTPTVYSITDSYDASMSSSWNNFDYFGDGDVILNEEFAETKVIVTEYTLTTPLKFSAGIAFISKFGFLTGDIELTNPSQTRYSSSNDQFVDPIDFSLENNDIKNLYKNTLNYRIGAEFRYKTYRLRGGYGVQGNGYQKDLGLDNSITNISGGAGVRTKSYFVDLALINSSQKKYSYQPYFLEDGSGPVADIKKNTFTGMITVGFIF